MAELNIVELIEQNPIINLNNTYQSKLITKIKEKFNDKEQSLFVASFYCYLKYNKNDFVIDLDNIWEWLGFKQKVNAKNLLEKNFKLDIDYKLLLLLQQKQTNTTEEKKRGGYNKETFLLTVKTFKKFCLKAGTDRADQIHEYYVKLEETIQEVSNEESNELKLQLEQQSKILENTKRGFNILLTNEKALEREKILLNEFGNNIEAIYIIKVKTYETGEYVVKIGRSEDSVEQRYKAHLTNYDECLLLDIFPVKKSKKFENFIHTHDDVKINKVKNLNGHENEIELFLIGNKLSYKQLLKIINTNIKHFNEYNETDFKELKNENEKLQNEIKTLKEILSLQNSSSISNDNTILQQILQEQKEQKKIIKILLEKSQNTDDKLEKSNKELLEKITPPPKITTIMGNVNLNVGDRLLQINPETKQIVKVYETVAEALKESNFKLKRPSIQKAVTENTIYQGSRWLYVDRNVEPTEAIKTLKETKETKVQNNGFIAKINKEKTEILTVYLDRKTAAHQNNYTSLSALDTPVKNNTITNGFYYMLYDNCDEELREKFEEKYGEPFLYKDGVGQYDTANNLVQEFTCKYDVIKKIKVGDKSLAKVLDNNILYNNFYYKTIGSKLSQGST
jgi:hypothetical protein